MWGNKTVSGLECNGPVYKVEIEVGESKLLQRLFELCLGWTLLVRAVPEFRGDEKLLASDDGWYDFFQRASDFVLVPVDPGKVKVAVPIADGNLDGVFDFVWLREPVDLVSRAV